MLATFYLIIGALIPLAVGYLAARLYIKLLQRGTAWQHLAFWLALLLFNLLLMFWAVTSAGKWTPIASMSVFFLTPVAALVSILVMRREWGKLDASFTSDLWHRRLYFLGLVLIPALQLLPFLFLIFFGSWLCTWGLITCSAT
jgi:hypothetical protein